MIKNALAVSALSVGLMFSAACSKNSASSSKEASSGDDSMDPNVNRGAYDALGFSSDTADGSLDLSGVYGRVLKSTWSQQEGDEGPIHFSQIKLNSDGSFTGLDYNDNAAQDKPLSGSYSLGFATMDSKGVTRKFPQISFSVDGQAKKIVMEIYVSKDGKSVSLDDDNAYYISPVYQ